MIRTDNYAMVKSKCNEYKDVVDNDFTPLVDTIIKYRDKFFRKVTRFWEKRLFSRKRYISIHFTYTKIFQNLKVLKY